MLSEALDIWPRSSESLNRLASDLINATSSNLSRTFAIAPPTRSISNRSCHRKIPVSSFRLRSAMVSMHGSRETSVSREKHKAALVIVQAVKMTFLLSSLVTRDFCGSEFFGQRTERKGRIAIVSVANASAACSIGRNRHLDISTGVSIDEYSTRKKAFVIGAIPDACKKPEKYRNRRNERRDRRLAWVSRASRGSDHRNRRRSGWKGRGN